MIKLASVLIVLTATGISASPDNPTKQELLQTVQHIGQLANQLQAELATEKDGHQKALADLGSANTQIGTLQKAIDTQADQLNKAIGERDHLLKQLHLLKIVVSAAVSTAIVFAIFYFAIPPPISFYIMAAALAAANGFIWWKL